MRFCFGWSIGSAADGLHGLCPTRFSDVTQEFTRLGFPDYFRIELTYLKLVGVVVVLVPTAPPRLKEWAYAGFTVVLGLAFITHLAYGDDVSKWIWSVGSFVLGALSYGFYRQK
jgi:hypothetical protein